MKTIITTICLAIILQFSAQTSVYADTATICAGEKWRAQNQGIPMSEKCKRNAAYGESSNLLPIILLGIVVLVIGIILFAFLSAGNHRAFAAIEAGEKYIWIKISDNQIQNIEEWE